MKALRILHLCIATLVPMVIGLSWGIIVAIFTLSRRKGLNQMTRLLGYIGPLIAATPIHVRSAQLATINRPAIFIFNHQSGLDPIILCTVIQRDVIGIAKEQLRYHPVIGPLLWFGETIFIDRLDKANRRAVYAPALDAIEKGRSIAIAPEGTRVNDMPIGEFKLGAFRIAQEANIPVVPIVIYNAKARLPARSRYLTTGPIDVEVLTPIEPSAFKDTVEETASAIRKQYLEKVTAYNNRISS